MITRRRFLLRSTIAGAGIAGLFSSRGNANSAPVNAMPSSHHEVVAPPIDRKALVSRHNVVRTGSKPGSPLQVGNGNFAFGADITGLQTFIPFNTMSDWGWYEAPLPSGSSPADFRGHAWDVRGRPVVYQTDDPAHPEITQWLFYNPYRLNLGRIGLRLLKGDGDEAEEADLTDCRQELNLWTGTLSSRFQLEGQEVHVQTACHPETDAVAVRITSPLVKAGRLSAFIDFPGADRLDFATYVGDWNNPDTHQTPWQVKGHRADIEHRLDGTRYHVSVVWNAGATFHGPSPDTAVEPLTILKARYGAEGHYADVTQTVAAAVRGGRLHLPVNNQTLNGDPSPQHPKGLDITYSLGGRTQEMRVAEGAELTVGASSTAHRFRLNGGSAEGLEFVCAFAPDPTPKALPDPKTTFAACAHHWARFWRSGAAIDLSGSRDPRGKELERRLVLSQYLMRVNEAGSLPPQESGLVNNGWSGKFHMEMYLWHGAHWALWDRWPELERSLGIYRRFLPSARKRAQAQGFAGARWPKMTSPTGRESPFVINALLLWQQPHPMFFAELDYRAHPTRETLEKWREVLFETADFMSSFASWDDASQRYVLGPPIFLVSENTEPRITQNPTFELSQWRFGLRVAQQWRERLGLARDPAWDRVLHGLAPLPVEEGVYVTYQGIPDMWTRYNFEHPGLIGAYGLLPGDGVDLPTMHRTAEKVFADWKFDATWGWDFPMLAMCAARLGEPAKAIGFILYPGPRFEFDDAGLATGGPFPYFPSNGGLLYAVALMAAGWEGAPQRPAPGFPDDGSWTVRAEGLHRAI